MSIACDGDGNISVNEIVTGVNDSLQVEDIGVTVQEDLVSGTNLKTINGETLLGSGDIEVSADAIGANILINAEVTRINQREFNGSSFTNGQYCWDRWKATASAMTQVIEAGNFLPNTEYTISGTNVTTAQVTSPSSGNWTIPEIPRTARNVKLEVGTAATLFVQENIGDDLLRCLRYYSRANHDGSGSSSTVLIDGSYNQQNTTHFTTTFSFKVLMASIPTIGYSSLNDFEVQAGGETLNVSSVDNSNTTKGRGMLIFTTQEASATTWTGVLVLNSPGWLEFDAEL